MPPFLDGTLHGPHPAELKSLEHKHIEREIREEICFEVCLFVLSKFFISWVGLMNCFVGFFKGNLSSCFLCSFHFVFQKLSYQNINFEWLIQKTASHIKIWHLIFYSSYQVRGELYTYPVSDPQYPVIKQKSIEMEIP